MTPAEILLYAQLGASLGLGAGGIGFCKWCFGIERRVYRLELKAKVTV